MFLLHLIPKTVSRILNILYKNNRVWPETLKFLGRHWSHQLVPIYSELPLLIFRSTWLIHKQPFTDTFGMDMPFIIHHKEKQTKSWWNPERQKKTIPSNALWSHQHSFSLVQKSLYCGTMQYPGIRKRRAKPKGAAPGQRRSLPRGVACENNCWIIINEYQ